MSKFWVSFLTVICLSFVLVSNVYAQDSYARVTAKLAGEGQMCGGIAGIICSSGLTCEYKGYATGAKLMPDASGVCVRTSKTIFCDVTGTCPRGYSCVKPELCPVGRACPAYYFRPYCKLTTPSPTCVPRPPCMDGVPGPTGEKIFCDPKPGVVYCPRVTPTVQKNCTSDSECGVNQYCYQPPMPPCPTGMACKQMMPLKVCRSCTPRPACADGIADSTGKLVYCDPRPGVVYCPKTTPIPRRVISSETRCVNGGGQAMVRVDGSVANVWMSVEEMSTGLKILYSYSQYGNNIVFGPVLNNGNLSGIRMGVGYTQSIKIVTGGDYKVKAFSALSTSGIPQNVTNLGEVIVRIPGCPATTQLGDADKDGDVDMVDFSIWKREFLNMPTSKTADFNNNGQVDMVDFSIWKNAFLNKKPTSVSVTPRAATATPTVTQQVSVTPQISSVEKPDLIANSYVSESRNEPGKYTVTTIVGNGGEAPVVADFKVNLYVDPEGDPNNTGTEPTQVISITENLGVGTTMQIENNMELVAGEHKFYTNVDPRGAVSESDEDNNKSYNRYTIREVCGWCGNSCTRAVNACPIAAPPEGKACITENNSCLIIQN